MRRGRSPVGQPACRPLQEMLVKRSTSTAVLPVRGSAASRCSPPKVHRTSGGRRQQEGQKVPTTLSEGTTVKSDLLTFCQLPFQKVRRCEKLQWDRISGQRHTVCHMGAWIAQSLQTNEDNTCSPMLRPLYVVLYVFRDQSRKTRIQ